MLRLEPEQEPDLHCHPSPLRRRQHLPPLCRRDRERFLDKDRHLQFERRHQLLEMQIFRRHDEQTIEIGMPKQFLKLPISPRHAILIPNRRHDLRDRIADRRQPRLRQPAQHSRVQLPEPPQPRQSDIDRSAIEFPRHVRSSLIQLPTAPTFVGEGPVPSRSTAGRYNVAATPRSASAQLVVLRTTGRAQVPPLRKRHYVSLTYP